MSDTNARTDATSSETDSLTVLLQKEARSRRKEELSTVAWAAVYVAIMMWTLTRPITDTPSLMRNLLFCVILMGVIGTAGCIKQLCRSYRRKRCPLTKTIAQAQNVTQVGPLIQTLRVQSTPVRNLAKEALIPLLPTMKASDATRLGDSERAILSRVLAIPPTDSGYRDLTELFSRSAYRREMQLRLAILKALEQVGGEKELATVERLSRGVPSLYSASKIPMEIQEAAKECLPYLQVRANDQSARAQLLRGSSATTLPNDVLLRPANTLRDARPELLLRAIEPGS